MSLKPQELKNLARVSCAMFSIRPQCYLHLTFYQYQSSTADFSRENLHRRSSFALHETTSNKCYAILLYDELSDYEEEISKLSKVIADDPRNVYARHNRGIAHWEIGEVEAARHDLSKAASLSDTEYMPHKMLGKFLHSLGETDAAIAAYKIGLQIFPDNPDINLNLAQIFADQHKYEDALKHIDVAIANNSGYVDIQRDRNRILEAMRNSSQ